MRRTLLVLAVLLAAPSAHAEDFVLGDGTRWQLANRALSFGTVTARVSPHAIGIDCATGLAARTKVALSYLPPNYIAYESVESDRTRVVACADAGPNKTIVVKLERHAALTPAEASAVRSLLVDLARLQAQNNSSKQDQLEPFGADKPILLSNATGDWDFFKLSEGQFAFLLQWPDTDAGIKISRTPALQQCSSVGMTYGARPAWAPSSFANYGASKDTWESACLDASDGHLLLVEVDSKMMPAAQRTRVTALLEAIVAAVGVAAPSVASPPTTTTTTSPSVADTSTSTSTPTYTPSYSSSDSGAEHVPLTQRLRGLSIALHRFGPSDDMIDTSYGVSLAYARTLRREGRLRPRIVVKGGYDAKSELLADLRLEIGAHVGEEEVGAEVFGAVGADGVGLGSDPAMDRVHIGFDAYYGVGARLWVDSIDLGFAYFARNADDIAGARKRFELGYRLSHGQRIGLDIDWYNDAGTFIAGSLTL